MTWTKVKATVRKHYFCLSPSVLQKSCCQFSWSFDERLFMNCSWGKTSCKMKCQGQRSRLNKTCFKCPWLLWNSCCCSTFSPRVEPASNRKYAKQRTRVQAYNRECGVLRHVLKCVMFLLSGPVCVYFWYCEQLRCTGATKTWSSFFNNKEISNMATRSFAIKWLTVFDVWSNPKHTNDTSVHCQRVQCQYNKTDVCRCALSREGADACWGKVLDRKCIGQWQFSCYFCMIHQFFGKVLLVCHRSY